MVATVSYRRVTRDEYMRAAGRHEKQTMPCCMLFYLAEKDGVVLGEIVFSKPAVGLGDPSMMSVKIHELDAYIPGRGIGGRLVALVEDETRREGIGRIVLNSENHAFWEHMGYELPSGFQKTKRAVKYLS